MGNNHHNGEPVADPGKLIRLTLRGHYVRWRLDNALAGYSRARTSAPAPAAPVPEAGRRAVDISSPARPGGRPSRRPSHRSHP